jgi:hypothetical protein
LHLSDVAAIFLGLNLTKPVSSDSTSHIKDAMAEHHELDPNGDIIILLHKDDGAVDVSGEVSAATTACAEKCP